MHGHCSMINDWLLTSVNCCFLLPAKSAQLKKIIKRDDDMESAMEAAIFFPLQKIDCTQQTVKTPSHGHHPVTTLIIAVIIVHCGASVTTNNRKNCCVRDESRWYWSVKSFIRCRSVQHIPLPPAISVVTVPKLLIQWLTLLGKHAGGKSVNG